MKRLTLTEAIFSIVIYGIFCKICPDLNFYNILIIAMYFHVVVKEKE